MAYRQIFEWPTTDQSKQFRGVHHVLLRFKIWQILSKIWDLKRDLSI